MEITATYRFAAPPPQVWALLMNPDAIRSCVPGCRELRPLGDNRFAAEIAFGVGAVSGAFTATIALADLDAPRSYRLLVDASGKPGFAKATARLLLKEAAAGTEVEVAATAEVGGLLARVGQRLVDGVARMSMDKFFSCLAGRL